MIGAMMTRPNSRLSPRSSISSFRTMCRTRFMSLRPLASKPQRRQPEDDGGEHRERDQVLPERGDADTLEDDAAQRGEEVASRHDVGDSLQKHRHARDRK